MDWFDIAKNTVLNQYKVPLKLKIVVGEVTDATFDAKINGGFQSILLGNKSIESISADLMFGALKFGINETFDVFKKNKKSSFITDVIIDQLKKM